MNIIFGVHTDSVGVMLGELYIKNTGYPVSGAFSAMGVIRDNKIIGQILFQNYTGANVDMHLYTPGCFSKNIINLVYSYMFNELSCKRVTAKVLPTNEKLLQLLPRLGFVYEYTQEQYYNIDGDIYDVLNYKLTKNNIPKWVNINGRV